MWSKLTVGGLCRIAVGVIACTIMLMAFGHVHATEPPGESSATRPFAEFVHRSYTPRDGAPNDVESLAQTSDGFLWLGSPTGLVRFDGVAFDASFGDRLPSPSVYSLFSDDDVLWIGHGFGGISSLRQGRLVTYDMQGLPGGSIHEFARRPDGVLWAAASKGLMRFVDGRWHALGADAGFPGQHVVWMQQVRGTLWVMDADGAYALDPGASRFRPVGKDEARRARAQVPPAATWNPQDEAGNFPFILTDSAGGLWISARVGLERDTWPAGRRQPTVDRMTSRDGLSGDSVWATLQDAEGNVWVGTDGGIDRFRTSKFTPIPLPANGQWPAFVTDGSGSLWAAGTLIEPVRIGQAIKMMPAMGSSVGCVARDHQGGVWMAGEDGLKRWADGKVTTVTLPDELIKANDPLKIAQAFQAIAMDADGGLWLSVAKYDLYRLKDGVWTRHDGRKDLPKGPAIRLFADDRDRLWLTYPDNLVVVIDHGKAKQYTASDGLAVGNVLAIYSHGDNVWVGGDLGVAYLEHGRFVALTGAAGNAFHGTAAIVETAAGELWLDSASGVNRIAADEVRRARAEPAHAVSFELFDAQDGLQGASIQIRPGPTLQQGSDGRLWVARFNGISWIDPLHIRRNHVAPKVSIESLRSADTAYPLTAALVLPKLTRNLQFDYTAPSLSRPQQVHFRYQLEGVDSGWQGAGTRRQAFYTNLGPGNYSFRVRAANEDDVWSTHDAVFDFRIAPAFYQTWWFDVLCGLAALVALWLLYLLRLRQLAARVRIRTVERERIARDLHDTLLQGVQGLQLRLQTWAVHKLLAPELRNEVTEVSVRARDMLIDGRDRIIALRRVDMRPAELIASLRAICEEYASMYHLRFSLEEHGQAHALLPDAAAEVLDIAREGLRNAFVHASARQVEVSIDWQPGALRIRVRDDGCGIDESILREGGRAGHWGLLGMRERAAKIDAKLDLQRCDEGGTELQLTVPARVAYAGMQSRLWGWMRRDSRGAIA
jgi:signal transduction histidine kinase/ligand-binding sensor domain-containing protein